MQHHYFINSDDLKEKRKELSFRFSNNQFKFISDSGVFSKDGIDFGSQLLLNTILENTHKTNLLDVGCGYGFIGIVFSKITNTSVDMIDINEKAVQLTQENIKLNNVTANAFVSNAFQNVYKKYDLIACNPPIRCGKKTIYHIFSESYQFLNNSGELWIVMRKQHGANSALNYLSTIFNNVEKITQSKGFWIIKCIK